MTEKQYCYSCERHRDKSLFPLGKKREMCDPCKAVAKERRGKTLSYPSQIEAHRNRYAAGQIPPWMKGLQ